MQLYHLFHFDRSLKIRWLAAELDITLDVIQLNARQGEHRQEAFKAINPYSLIPTLVTDDGQTLFEAGAISLYLCRLHGTELINEVDPEFMQWLFYFSSSLDQLSGGIIGLKVLGECEKVRAKLEAKIPSKLAAMEAHLINKDYWYQDKFSLLDIFAWQNLAYLRNDKQLQNYPNLNRYIEKIATRPHLAQLGADKLLNPS
ncbi:hypothetical protein C2869_04850 [Saccharobesus litoralis]|uniref:Glutathione S-transferase n=1 Tax=Saccharobesus litoralis TaxID=2172099 RepID=A0A2S0VNL1_9ALTE|nr:glutathione S-transferase family protein [Saccharobesus litoralis]AWB65808.1 hypothetical protein C2869_04850 [Saccharobesus litoralis]